MYIGPLCFAGITLRVNYTQTEGRQMLREGERWTKIKMLQCANDGDIGTNNSSATHRNLV